MLVDSHCHLNMLDLAPYHGDMSLLLKEAAQQGVEHVLCVGVDIERAQEVIQIAEQHHNVYASVGLHPSDPVEHEPTEAELIKLASHPKVIAIGETGLDYHYADNDRDIMRERFRRHIRVARHLNKPLIIHTREAREDTIAILHEEKANEVRGVMHCFTENLAMAKAAIELGFYISFSGIVTFKNAGDLVEVAQALPLENILIETDAPYLTPVPYRGKPNYPQYVRFVAEKIATIKQVTIAEVEQITSKNFFDLFHLNAS